MDNTKKLSWKDLAAMKWSYSRLNSFHSCKRAWYYQYVIKSANLDNFFSQYGTYFHQIMEKHDKGELELFELTDYYRDSFHNFVTEHAPPNKYVDIKDSYYKKGLSYFEKFDGHKDNTLIAELKINFSLEHKGYNFDILGYIDRVSSDDNGLIITDYKSKSKFKKNEKDEYLKQLYMYAIGINEVYNKYPYKLVFDMFKEGIIVEEEFDEAKISQTIEWCKSVLEEIEQEVDYLPKSESPKKDFFCRYICGFYEICVEDVV